MVTIAVAGGTGGVGRTIVDALKEDGKHKVIVLSRKAPSAQDPVVPVLAVDYNDVDALVKTLEDNSIDLVISTVLIMDEASKVTETNLIHAADKSKPTKRFIISNWGILTPPEKLRMSAQHIRHAVIQEIRKTTLEWTQFYDGFFLDYYAMPYISSHMNPVTYVLDIANKSAVIPGTGNEPVSITYTKDLAKFVVKALDIPVWEEEYGVYSVQTTWNEFLRRAEEATGSKFNVIYDPVEKLEKGEATMALSMAAESYVPPEVMRILQVGFGLFSVHGLFHVPEEKALNKRFPEIKTLSLDDVLSYWKAK